MKRFLLICLIPLLWACEKNEAPLWTGATEIGTFKSGVFAADAGWTGRITEAVVDAPTEDYERILLHFDMLRPNAGGSFDLRLTGWVKPLTKPGLLKSAADPDDIGSDPITLVNGWFAGGYINMELRFTASKNTKVTHFINLVLDDVSPKNPEEPDTLRFRLHHNGYGDVFYPTDPKGSNAADYVTGTAWFCVPSNVFLPEGTDEMPIKITWPWYETDDQGLYTDRLKDFSRKGTLKRYPAKLAK